MREWGWKHCRPLPAACRGIPEGSDPGPPGFPSPPPPPRPSPAPAPPGRAPAPGPAAAASSRPRQELGSPRGLQAADGAPWLTGGLHRAPGCWMPGSSWELLGNLPALPRAKSRHIKGGWGQREAGQEPLVPASTRLHHPTELPPPCAGVPCRHTWVRGRAPLHGVAPSPSPWQPPPAPGVFSAPGPPWEPGRVPPHSAGLSGPPL